LSACSFPLVLPEFPHTPAPARVNRCLPDTSNAVAFTCKPPLTDTRLRWGRVYTPTDTQNIEWNCTDWREREQQRRRNRQTCRHAKQEACQTPQVSSSDTYKDKYLFTSAVSLSGHTMQPRVIKVLETEIVSPK
jgi:hypothetical protein